MSTERQSDIRLLLPDPAGDRMVPQKIDDSKPAHQQKSFFTAFMALIAQTRKDTITMTEQQMILYAMKRKDCKPSECVAGFWSAFDDPYVPATGVEWRHIVKHIDAQRGGGSNVTYRHDMTDDEMESLRRLQRKYEPQSENNE